MNITGLTPAQLRRAADLQERILDLQKQLTQILGSEEATPATAPARSSAGKKRKLSAAGRAAIVAAAKARWAKLRGSKPQQAAKQPKAGRRQMSPAARARIAAAAKARWAKAKAAGKNRL